MEKLLKNMSIYLFDGCNYDKDTQDIILYGIEILILKITFLLASILIGTLFGLFLENIVYMIAFILLRTYAGGYHSNSRIICFVKSMITIILSMLAIVISNKYSILNLLLYFFAIISFVTVFALAPIDSNNEKLEKKEINRFRKKARVILYIESFFAILAYLIGFVSITKATILAIITVAVLVISGYIYK